MNLIKILVYLSLINSSKPKIQVFTVDNAGLNRVHQFNRSGECDIVPIHSTTGEPRDSDYLTFWTHDFAFNFISSIYVFLASLDGDQAITGVTLLDDVLYKIEVFQILEDEFDEQKVSIPLMHFIEDQLMKGLSKFVKTLHTKLSSYKRYLQVFGNENLKCISNSICIQQIVLNETRKIFSRSSSPLLCQSAFENTVTDILNAIKVQEDQYYEDCFNLYINKFEKFIVSLLELSNRYDPVTVSMLVAKEKTAKDQMRSWIYFQFHSLCKRRAQDTVAHFIFIQNKIVR